MCCKCISLTGDFISWISECSAGVNVSETRYFSQGFLLTKPATNDWEQLNKVFVFSLSLGLV